MAANEKPKIVDKKGKSWVWAHFGIMEGNKKKAVRKICFKEYA